jgi:hypothetical protein
MAARRIVVVARSSFDQRQYRSDQEDRSQHDRRDAIRARR